MLGGEDGRVLDNVGFGVICGTGEGTGLCVSTVGDIDKAAGPCVVGNNFSAVGITAGPCDAGGFEDNVGLREVGAGEGASLHRSFCRPSMKILKWT